MTVFSSLHCRLCIICLSFLYVPSFCLSTIPCGSLYHVFSFTYPNHRSPVLFSFTSRMLFPTFIDTLVLSFLSPALLVFLGDLLQKSISIASNSLILHVARNYRTCKELNDFLGCMHSDSFTAVHYRIFLRIKDSTSQSLPSSVLKAPTLVKVSRLCAAFLRSACSHVADRVSRQAC